ncbi:DUF2339 domain-containing protein [Butyrivibrio sp. AE3003]|uniref:DUF2339 domain-containing protein n=1 Tax=Butyrivibrio sp. AE3003 TaxID=1496721 RepID=UPI00047871B3|nr:DUF2339 domain-containing protein [Butyrivibrio sp. AE3003]
MGQIEELERELESIKYQVGQIQLALSRVSHVVADVKAEQNGLHQQLQQANMQIGSMQHQQQVQANVQPQQQVQGNVQPQPQMQVNMQLQQAQTNMQSQGVQYQYQRVQSQITPQPMQNQQAQFANQPMQNHPQAQFVNQAMQNQPQAQFANQAMQNHPQAQFSNQSMQPQHPFQNYTAGKRNSTESWIGKHLMGVLASVLVFIALILFASLIIPYLNDTVKIGMMFTVSIALTSFAFYEHKKRPDNTFFTALLACGLGCSYLSILVTRIYFKAISDVIMYVLLLVWGGVILYMGKKESRLFQAIGNSGYIISALLAWNMEDKAMVLPILIYLIVMGAAFQYNFRKSYGQRIVQSCINMGIILYFATRIGNNVEKCVPLTVSAILIVVISAVYFACSIYGEKLIKDKNRFIFAPVSAVVFYVSYLLLADCLDLPKWISLTVFFAVAVIAEVVAFMQQSKAEDDTVLLLKNIWIIAWFAVAEFATFILYNDFFNTGALFVALLPMAVYGAKKEHNLFRNQALILAALMTALEVADKLNIVFCSVALVYAIIVVVMEGFIVNKSVYYKIIYFIYVQVCIAFLFCAVSDKYTHYDSEFRLMFTIIPMGMFNALMRVLKFDRDDKGISNKSVLLGLDVINAIGILVGLYNIIEIDGALPQGINIAFTTALACINIRRHFAGSSGEKLYAGIKFGIILLVSLITYDAAGYIISVATLAFAILCIFIGFNKIFGAKELRIYGLVLSMICVVKFIMIDITYENTIGRAISFLISGILCFAISALYNHFEKQGQ